MTPQGPELPSGLLIIGYGNTLRRDDGVGPKVAEAVAALALPGVRALAYPLLTPELAEAVSQARVVIFVDAAVDAPRGVQLRKLAPAEDLRSWRTRRARRPCWRWREMSSATPPRPGG